MTYAQRLDRVNPGLIVLLVDQSESMAEPLAGGYVSKAAVVAEHLNSLLYELILRCVKTPANHHGHTFTSHSSPIALLRTAIH